MRQVVGTLQLTTLGPGLHGITDAVVDWLAGQGADEGAGGGLGDGVLTLLCQHTSASLTIQENADPDVCLDLQDSMTGLAPRGGAERYRHHMEGTDDMAAHIRTVLSGVHLVIPLQAGRLMLGTWQGIYLWEHRDRPHRRQIALHLLMDRSCD